MQSPRQTESDRVSPVDQISLAFSISRDTRYALDLASFRQAMLLSQGSLSIFWSNPLVASIAGLAIILLLWPLVGIVRGRLQTGRAATA